MTRIILVRHGHVEGIKPERFRGRQDLPLTKHGKAEAQAVARHVAANWQPTHVYTSPMARCMATARAIGEACKLEPLMLDHLTDIDYGAWQWKSYADAKEADPELFQRWFMAPHLARFPNGESLQELVARSADALRLVLDRHPADTVILVSHDSVNRALLLQLLDQPLSAYWRLAQEPCCINDVELVEGQLLVRCINATDHLAGIMRD
jgi:phosphoserine phosphatase